MFLCIYQFCYPAFLSFSDFFLKFLCWTHYSFSTFLFWSKGMFMVLLSFLANLQHHATLGREPFQYRWALITQTSYFHLHGLRVFIIYMKILPFKFPLVERLGFLQWHVFLGVLHLLGTMGD